LIYRLASSIIKLQWLIDINLSKWGTGMHMGYPNMRLQTFALAIVILFVAAVGIADEGDCVYCGMSRAKFGHSWVIIKHDNGSESGVCSIHCAAIDMALHSAMPVSKITVGDYDTQRQIDADKAYWVIGGDKLGVMTARAKWAFKTKNAADNFMKDHGGRPATFEEVMRAAFEDMYEDTLILQKKRRLMKMRDSKKQQ
jgi:nitrous oxide reductase accessory protein NosL